MCDVRLLKDLRPSLRELEWCRPSKSVHQRWCHRELWPGSAGHVLYGGEGANACWRNKGSFLVKMVSNFWQSRMLGCDACVICMIMLLPKSSTWQTLHWEKRSLALEDSGGSTGSYWVILSSCPTWVPLGSNCHPLPFSFRLTGSNRLHKCRPSDPHTLQDYEGVLWVKPMGSASVTLSLLVNDTLAGTETWPLPKVSQWQLGGSWSYQSKSQEICLIREVCNCM